MIGSYTFKQFRIDREEPLLFSFLHLTREKNLKREDRLRDFRGNAFKSFQTCSTIREKFMRERMLQLL